MTTNDNNNGPKKPLLVPDRKIVDLKGQPIRSQDQTPDVQEEPTGPTERVFQFDTTKGSFQKQGFIIATSAFIGLAVNGGEIIAVVPMAQLFQAIAVDVEKDNGFVAAGSA